jgi:type IV secretion system protein VirB11
MTVPSPTPIRTQKKAAASSKEFVLSVFGPVLCDLMAKKALEEISRNPDGRLWVKEAGPDWRCVGSMSDIDTSTLIQSIAGDRGHVINEKSPALETELPELGVRFTAARPPICKAPLFSIRKMATRVYPLSDYVAFRVMTQEQADFLESAVLSRQNVLIGGGTGSGKTTLLNTLLEIIARKSPMDRVVTIEDTMEIQCSSENLVNLYAKGDFRALDCLKLCLRLYPGRLVTGEVRDEEANAMLKSWNTGHPGSLATIHASSAAKSLTRLENLVRESSVSVRNAKTLIADAVQVVVYMAAEKNLELYPAGRSVREIARVLGYSRGKYQLEEVRMASQS